MTNGQKFIDIFHPARVIYDEKADSTTIQLKGDWWDKKYEGEDEVEQEPKISHCKDCKYFEYDSMAKVNGVPIIVAHEICKRWGDGCKSKENGYCFLYEPQESEG